MGSRKAFGVAIGLALILASTNRAADPAPALFGAWTYLREVDTRLDGSKAPIPAPEEAKGSLIYTADGPSGRYDRCHCRHRHSSGRGQP